MDPLRRLVVDASALVDFLIGAPTAPGIGHHFGSAELCAPGHLELEVLSALGRLVRAESLGEAQADRYVELMAALPIRRTPLSSLVIGTWKRRGSTRISDAYYLELADQLKCRVITTDARFARNSPIALLVT